METGKSTIGLERTDVTQGEDAGSCPAEGGASPTRIRAGRTKSLKRKTETRKALSLEEAQLEMQQQTTSRLALPRSQTFAGDRSLEKSDSANSRTSFIKHNKTFHKLFPDVPENEDLVHAYICALQREVPYHGRLYITESNVCFHSSVLLKATKVVIPVSSIHVLKKQNTALLVPNALSIRTNIGEKYLFVSLRNRESCYKLLLSVCPLLEDGSANSSPIFSSAENSLDHGKLVNSSQSSLTDAFEELDGSSSGLLLQPPPSRHNRGTVSNASPLGEQDESSTEEYSGGSWVWSVTDRARSLITQREATNLNTLLLIYLMLVLLLLLSSGYIGLRIVALEEQLTSLGALPEFTLHSRYKDTQPNT
ncbi:GRAM domain-containing protein 2B isoform X1 [Electrophorus electricus]|uniref:GRAM domain-containing protein n=1 Tax=Electrophorus electricus TaxID=8005 RepID=A0AAY5EJG1_ELEEL|nr:GRAM domain-containing protein 2B isoform X1 [Electrophorus electricus]